LGKEKMSEYHDVRKARSPQAFGGLAVVAAFGIGFFLIDDLPFRIAGCVFLLAGMSGVYAIWKREEWSLHVAAGILEWHYPRSSNPDGKVALSSVERAVIDDGDAALILHFRDAVPRKIKLASSGYALREHLASCYPHITVDYIASSSPA
jgi:hypothetical protein